MVAVAADMWAMFDYVMFRCPLLVDRVFTLSESMKTLLSFIHWKLKCKMASSEDVSGHTTSVSILGGNIFSAYCTLNIVKHGVHACWCVDLCSNQTRLITIHQAAVGSCSSSASSETVRKPGAWCYGDSFIWCSVVQVVCAECLWWKQKIFRKS